jgi:hypothetical protein
MRTLVVTTLAAVGCLLAFGEQRACAQLKPGIYVPPPVTQPPISPYLNLFRPGSLTQNYIGLVQPELQWRGNVGGLQLQVADQAQAIGGLKAAQQGALVTGHHTSWLSTGGYFGTGPGAGR